MFFSSKDVTKRMECGADLHTYERFFDLIHGLKRTPLEIAIRKGIHYLEFNCSATHGFCMEVSNTPEMTLVNPAIPAIFDSSFLLPIIMNLNVNKRLINNVTSLILEHRRESGFWNMYYDPRLMVDDIDNTSMAAYALLQSGTMTQKECRLIGEKLLQTVLKDQNGVYNTFLPPSKTKAQQPLMTFHDKVRIDLGSLCNMMVFMTSVGMDTKEELRPTLDVLDNALDALLASKDFSEPIEHARYYSNQHVLCFLLSRFVTVSDIGKERFKDKLQRVCKDRLGTGSGLSSTEIACRILAALNINMHEEDESIAKLLMEEAAELLKLQKSDGSFIPYYFYEVKTYCYFGSPSVSTGLACAALELLQRKIPTCNTSQMLQQAAMGNHSKSVLREFKIPY